MIPSPSSITGLVVGNSADDLTGNDGDAIATLPASWGTSLAATQATGSKKPIQKNGIINGHKVARFDGTDDFLQLTNASSLVSTGGTLFAIFSLNADTEYVVFGTVAETVNDEHWRFSGDGKGYFGTLSTTRKDGHPSPMPTSGVHVVIVRSMGGLWDLWLDGQQAYTTATNTFSAGQSNWTIGVDQVFGSRFVNGDIAATGTYNAAISDANLHKLQGYLLRYAGLSLIENLFAGTSSTNLTVDSAWYAGHAPYDDEYAVLDADSFTSPPSNHAGSSIDTTWSGLILRNWSNSGLGGPLILSAVAIEGDLFHQAYDDDGDLTLTIGSVNGSVRSDDLFTNITIANQQASHTAKIQLLNESTQSLSVTGGTGTIEFTDATDSLVLTIGSSFTGTLKNSQSSPTVNKVDLHGSPLSNAAIANLSPSAAAFMNYTSASASGRRTARMHVNLPGLSPLL